MNEISINDIHLFGEIKSGNRLALDTLFKKYYQQLCYFVETYTSNSYISEELVADIFTTIWIKRKQIDIKKSIKSYLYTSAKNAALMHLRKKRYLMEDLESVKYISKNDTNPEQIIIKNETCSKVNKCLELIPPKSRQVFILHRLDGLRYKEIAEIM